MRKLGAYLMMAPSLQLDFDQGCAWQTAEQAIAEKTAQRAGSPRRDNAGMPLAWKMQKIILQAPRPVGKVAADKRQVALPELLPALGRVQPRKPLARPGKEHDAADNLVDSVDGLEKDIPRLAETLPDQELAPRLQGVHILPLP